MGIFSSKAPSGPSAAEIRAEEEEASKQRASKSLVESEQRRQALRQRQAGTVNEEISRKTLFGQ